MADGNAQERRNWKRQNGEPESSGDQSESDLDSDDADSHAASAQTVRPRPIASSRLVDWLTLPGQVVSYAYDGDGEDAEITVGLRQTLCLSVVKHLQCHVVTTLIHLYSSPG